MQAYVTKEYDFHNAISKNIDVIDNNEFVINTVDVITDNSSIIKTTYGDFLCESFEDVNASVYMKVFPII